MAIEPLAVLMKGREFRHTEPVWRERSDFIIGASLDDTEGVEREQLWARRLGRNEFEVCCIPFFVYGLSLGDIVETSPTGGRQYMVSRVVRPSGRHVLRVWFGDSRHPSSDVVERLAARGALLEWSSSNLLAVDAQDEEMAASVFALLEESQSLGQLLFEVSNPI